MLMFQPLVKYADFTGRARRSEYWLFVLLNFVTALFAITLGGDVLMTLVWLGLVIPNIAVAARRLHDIDMSGWWLLISLLPFIGAIVLLVFMLLPGTSGENRFGADPRT
jgi:uncharacterized membrane protein YhaH (DUF805 family)